MWQYDETNLYLCHWGIKGQKWGVRRYQNRDGTLTAEGKIRYSNGHTSHPDYVRAHSKKIEDMSDEELRTYVNRLNLESQYKKYTSSPSKVKKAIAVAATATAALSTLNALYVQSDKTIKMATEIVNKLSKLKT